MNTFAGIIVRNPFRTLCVVATEYKKFEYSKYLLDKHTKLTNKFYKRILLRNNIIVWSTTIFSSLITVLTLLCSVYFSKLYLILDAIAANLLGFSIAMVVIMVGIFIHDKMSDIFPTDSWYININKRK